MISANVTGLVPCQWWVGDEEFWGYLIDAGSESILLGGEHVDIMWVTKSLMEVS